MKSLRIGKTLLAKTLARVVNVPFTIADATALTQVSLFSGWLFSLSLLMFFLSFLNFIFICMYILNRTIHQEKQESIQEKGI